MIPENYPLEYYVDRNVRIKGTFIYFPEDSYLHNLVNNKAFLMTYNENFIRALEENDIANYKINDETLYISDTVILYGRAKKLSHTYILDLHHFSKSDNVT